MMIARVGQRAERRRLSAFSARSILVGVLALLFVFQSLAAVASSITHLARRGAAASVVSVGDAPCVADSHRGDAPPAHSGDHAQCCVLCGARDFDGAAVASLTPASVAFTPRRLFAAPVRLREARVRPPTGWASSWSSQAPPYFS
ncbi:hypothetical protein [Methylosinus sporium]|uniref:hypothetical protein n=1 Tax=Methylosinus sporium TaxID=428 RepID=UPI00383B9302